MTKLFALILTVFYPQPDGLARADVHVLESGLTAISCMEMMAEAERSPSNHSVLACAFDEGF